MRYIEFIDNEIFILCEHIILNNVYERKKIDNFSKLDGHIVFFSIYCKECGETHKLGYMDYM